uniref:Protein kinase domain-containing protein n=1 Tax=Trichuris muris TaxID=70415 RepID=A0A5S6Q6Y3_TRIMR
MGPVTADLRIINAFNFKLATLTVTAHLMLIRFYHRRNIQAHTIMPVEQRNQQRNHVEHACAKQEGQEQKTLNHGQLLGDRWRLLEIIGRGGFGEVYRVSDNRTKELFAAKVVLENTRQAASLKREMAILQSLKGCQHMCTAYASGVEGSKRYLVMTLAGPSLDILRWKRPMKKFSRPTTLMLFEKCYFAVKELHNAGYVHRDIKPANFAIGREQSSREVLLLDFGITKRYRDLEGNVRPQRENASFCGTPRYASPNAHANKEVGPQDDLISLLYSTVEMAEGDLPWGRLQDNEEIRTAKSKISMKVLLKGLPKEMHEISGHLSSLTYADPVNYEWITDKVVAMLARLGINYNSPFDWEDTQTFPERSNAPRMTAKVPPT